MVPLGGDLACPAVEVLGMGIGADEVVVAVVASESCSSSMSMLICCIDLRVFCCTTNVLIRLTPLT